MTQHPRVFVTSDHHFYHTNIIKYCNRPFLNIENMNNELIKRWNNVIAKEDIVYHLGDFFLGNKKEISRIVNLLHGKIRLIMGNHDHASIRNYYEYGFNEVYRKPVILIQYNVILSHAPIINIDKYGILKNIHGHIHNSSSVNFTHTSYNACVEVNDYKPILIDDALKTMNDCI